MFNPFKRWFGNKEKVCYDFIISPDDMKLVCFICKHEETHRGIFYIENATFLQPNWAAEAVTKKFMEEHKHDN